MCCPSTCIGVVEVYPPRGVGDHAGRAVVGEQVGAVEGPGGRGQVLLPGGDAGVRVQPLKAVSPGRGVGEHDAASGELDFRRYFWNEEWMVLLEIHKA